VKSKDKQVDGSERLPIADELVEFESWLSLRNNQMRVENSWTLPIACGEVEFEK
jgi:hypothetical protein